MYSIPSNQPKQKPNLLPDAEYNKEWPQERSFKLVKKFNDPRFGDISVLKNQANQVVLVKEKLASSKMEATEDIIYLKKRLEINHPHIMKLLGYSAVVNKELCSTTYVTKAFYEFPRTDAYKELIDRQKQGAEFTHSELTHMSYQLMSGLESLHQKGFAHGDIRPQLIGYDKQRNHFEFLDRLGDPTPIERCQTNNIINNKEIYISPQLYKKLKSKDKSAMFEPRKNDIFALGVTILHLGNGRSAKELYLPDGNVCKWKLQEYVMEFDNKYSDENPLLCNILKELLRTEKHRNHTIECVIKELPSYDEYKRDEASGNLLKNKKFNTAFNLNAQTKVNSTPQQMNYFDNNANVKLETEVQTNMQVNNNDEFDDYNPYMVKTNQVQNQYEYQNQNNYQYQNQNQYQYQNQNQYQYQDYQPYQQNYNNGFQHNTATTTYVRSTPQQLHTYGQAQYNQQPTYVQSTPYQNNSVYAQSQPTYVQSNNERLSSNTKTEVYYDENGYKVIRRSYQAAPVETRKSYNEEQVEFQRNYQAAPVEVKNSYNGNKMEFQSNYQAAPVEVRNSYNGNKVEVRGSYQNSNVEVRRGSNNPSNPETKVIKKRYVMREDGTVVELDPNAELSETEIRKYFDNSYNKDTVAKYDNVDQALKSDH